MEHQNALQPCCGAFSACASALRPSAAGNMASRHVCLEPQDCIANFGTPAHTAWLAPALTLQPFWSSRARHLLAAHRPCVPTVMARRLQANQWRQFGGPIGSLGVERGILGPTEGRGRESWRRSISATDQPMSEASLPLVSCEIVTARISAPPLKTLVTHSGMPSIERPVMPVARK